MMYIQQKAPAKINLNLAILGKRANAYHTISSLVVFTDYGDTVGVRLHKDRKFTLHIEGQFKEDLQQDKNIILDAANLLHKQFPYLPTAHIYLEKNIPVASGMGGGSSNASAIIKALLKIWQVKAPDNLHDNLLTLGCDVPACYEQRPLIMEGIGEQVTPIMIPSMHIVLANPRIWVNTKDVFHMYKEKYSPIPAYPKFQTYKDILAFLQQSTNDLTVAASSLHPSIKSVLACLSSGGAEYVNMSGSGGTCYGLCKNAEIAQHMAKIAVKMGFWAVATETLCGEKISSNARTEN